MSMDKKLLKKNIKNKMQDKKDKGKYVESRRKGGKKYKSKRI